MVKGLKHNISVRFLFNDKAMSHIPLVMIKTKRRSTYHLALCVLQYHYVEDCWVIYQRNDFLSMPDAALNTRPVSRVLRVKEESIECSMCYICSLWFMKVRSNVQIVLLLDHWYTLGKAFLYTFFWLSVKKGLGIHGWTKKITTKANSCIIKLLIIVYSFFSFLIFSANNAAAHSAKQNMNCSECNCVYVYKTSWKPQGMYARMLRDINVYLLMVSRASNVFIQCV